MLWLFLSCDASGIPPVGFALDPVDLGDARVSGEGMDLGDGAAAGLAFAAVMPGWEAGGLPPWDVPAAIWEIALHERVADEGVCPFVTLDGGDATYQSDCRSKHGYEWEGTAKVTRSDEDGVERERWDYDLSVVGDIDDARFERLSLRGAVARAVDGDLTCRWSCSATSRPATWRTPAPHRGRTGRRPGASSRRGRTSPSR
jgi:hypothetical protein